MEPNAWYYRRRATEEMMAAHRAVTEAARDRRLYLVRTYLDHLRALGEPWPFADDDFAALRTNCGVERSAFGWNKDNRPSARRRPRERFARTASN